MYKRGIILFMVTAMLFVIRKIGMSMVKGTMRKSKKNMGKMFMDMQKSTVKKMNKFSPTLYRRKRKNIIPGM